MKRSRPRLTGAVLCVVGLACVVLSAKAQQLEDLPLGYLKMTEGDGGKFNIEARCVPTQALLEDIAKIGGIDISFDKECKSYATIHRPGRYELAEYWLKVVAGSGGNMGVQLEGRECRVFVSADPGVDASLSSAEIVEKCATAIPSVKSPGTGIEKGLLVLKGHVIEPPYQLDVESESTQEKESARVTVNGLVFTEFSRIPLGATKMEERATMVPQSGQFLDAASLRSYVAYTFYPEQLKVQGSAQGALQQVIGFLKTQTIVEEIVDVNPPINVKFNQLAVTIGVMPGYFDYETGAVKKFPVGEEQPLREIAERDLESLKESLGLNCLVLVRGSGSYCLLRGGDRLGKIVSCVDAVETLDKAVQECMLGDVMGGREVARDLVANNDSLVRFEAELERLIESEKKDPALSSVANPDNDVLDSKVFAISR